MDGLNHQPHRYQLRSYQLRKRRQVSHFMSAQRMTLEPRKSVRYFCLHRAARSLRLAAGLIALAVPLGGCGTGALWDKFTAKDDTFIEEPADKLYNEGLYLMNQRKDNEGGHEEIRGSRPPASLFRLRAQIAADVGVLVLLTPAIMTAALARRPVTSPCIRAAPTPPTRNI